MNIAISIKDLIKEYPKADRKAVNSLSLEVPSKTIFGLLGPNGAGKTTTISIVCGLLKMNAGNVDVLGKDVSSDLRSVKSRIGVVPQTIALYPSLTALENLRFFGAMYNLSKSVVEERANELLKVVGLQDTNKKRVEYFSGGMKRRLNLIAALLHEPELLFLDEPTVGIDVQSRNLILEYLKKLNQEGMTILYTSHHLDEAQDLCHRIGIIDEGELIIEGEPSVLIKEGGCDDLSGLFLKLTGKELRD